MSRPKHEQGIDCPGCNDRLLEGCDEIVNFFKIFKEKYPDLHTSCVFRNKEDQEAAVRSGASKLHWPNSLHNKTPSRAIDLFQIDPKGRGVFDPVFYYSIFVEAEKMGLPIEWGGQWIYFKDTPHFQLKK